MSVSRFSNERSKGNRESATRRVGSGHTPVLLKEVIEYLNVQSGDVIVDATLNGGGHTRALLEQFPDVRVLGIEWDAILLEDTTKSLAEFGERLMPVNDSYVNMASIVRDRHLRPRGVLFDLGLSSWHYEASGRGFSFKKEEPLDMRYDIAGNAVTARDILKEASQDELETMLREYGEEQFAHSIAEAIVKARKHAPIATTNELVVIIRSAVPEWYTHRKIHFATKTFQALRVTVNHELSNVQRGLQAAIDTVRPGGRIVAISFQGMEDKAVRQVFKENVARGTIRWVTKDTIRPSWEEIKNNPRARSAKMKIAEKLDVSL